MTHEEFMKQLCHIVAAFSEKVSGGDPGPCFCLDNEVAKIEHKHGTWRGSQALLHALEQKLNKE
jgi:hypothetical protein